jgi:hypothetical protein
MSVLLTMGVLGLWRVVAQTPAVPGAGQPPFASAVEQRRDMIRELQGIQALLKEQNGLLQQLVEKQNAGGAAKTSR